MAKVNSGIWFGAEAMATALGDGMQTVSSISSYRSGLKYNETFRMIAGEIPGKSRLDSYTELETLMITQVAQVLDASGLSLSDPGVALIISTTKGNVGLLEGNTEALPDDAFLQRVM